MNDGIHLLDMANVAYWTYLPIFRQTLHLFKLIESASIHKFNFSVGKTFLATFVKMSFGTSSDRDR